MAKTLPKKRPGISLDELEARGVINQQEEMDFRDSVGEERWEGLPEDEKAYFLMLAEEAKKLESGENEEGEDESEDDSEATRLRREGYRNGTRRV